MVAGDLHKKMLADSNAAAALKADLERRLAQINALAK
jgi:hypothetical protein